MHALQLLAQQKIDADVLKNGVSYFLGPLLNWTLVGVIKSLVKDVQARGSGPPLKKQSFFIEFGLIYHHRFSHAAPFLEIVSTLLSSSLCPKPVMSLCAQALVRAFSDPRARGSGGVPPPPLVGLWNTVNKGLGLPESTTPFPLPPYRSSIDRMQRTRYSPRATDAMGEPSPPCPSNDSRSSTQGQTSLPRH